MTNTGDKWLKIIEYIHKPIPSEFGFVFGISNGSNHSINSKIIPWYQWLAKKNVNTINTQLATIDSQVKGTPGNFEVKGQVVPIILSTMYNQM